MATSAKILNRSAAAALCLGVTIAILGGALVSLRHRDGPPTDGEEPPANDPLGGYSEEELPEEGFRDGRYFSSVAYDLQNIRHFMPWT